LLFLKVGQGFNRDKWNDLEKEVRNLVKKYDNVWVVTGPLYLPKRESDNKSYVKYEVIGNNNVAVPTHFFKVVLCEKQGIYSLYPYVLIFLKIFKFYSNTQFKFYIPV